MESPDEAEREDWGSSGYEHGYLVSYYPDDAVILPFFAFLLLTVYITVLAEQQLRK